jgi:putative transposase
MALEGYKSNNNVVYSSKYHCVWTPKYRRSVLVGPIAKRCEQVIRQTAEKYRAEIIALEIMPEHVHGLVEVDSEQVITAAGLSAVEEMSAAAKDAAAIEPSKTAPVVIPAPSRRQAHTAQRLQWDQPEPLAGCQFLPLNRDAARFYALGIAKLQRV